MQVSGAMLCSLAGALLHSVFPGLGANVLVLGHFTCHAAEHEPALSNAITQGIVEGWRTAGIRTVLYAPGLRLRQQYGHVDGMAFTECNGMSDLLHNLVAASRGQQEQAAVVEITDDDDELEGQQEQDEGGGAAEEKKEAEEGPMLSHRKAAWKLKVEEPLAADKDDAIRVLGCVLKANKNSSVDDVVRRTQTSESGLSHSELIPSYPCGYLLSYQNASWNRFSDYRLTLWPVPPRDASCAADGLSWPGTTGTGYSERWGCAHSARRSQGTAGEA